jgi:hypothetical protein
MRFSEVSIGGQTFRKQATLSQLGVSQGSLGGMLIPGYHAATP